MTTLNTDDVTDALRTVRLEFRGRIRGDYVAAIFRRLEEVLGLSEGDSDHEAENLHEAVRMRLKAGDDPGKTIRWEPFCDLIRNDLGTKGFHRGHSDKSIYRAVVTIRKE